MPAPSNDLRANAIVLTPASDLPYALVGLDTTAATGYDGDHVEDPYHGDDYINTRSVWWRLTADVTGSLTVRTDGSSYPTIVSAWNGAGPFSNNTEIVEALDPSSGTPLVVPVISGQTYTILVERFGDLDFTGTAAGGSLNVYVSAIAAAPPGPDNDAFADATVIDPLPFSDTVDTTGATTDVGDPANPTNPTLNHANVWYTFTPATTAVYRYRWTSNYSARVVVFTGSYGAFTVVSANGFDNGAWWALQLTSGVAYSFMVGGAVGGGSLTFQFEQPAQTLSDPIGGAVGICSGLDRLSGGEFVFPFIQIERPDGAAHLVLWSYDGTTIPSGQPLPAPDYSHGCALGIFHLGGAGGTTSYLPVDPGGAHSAWSWIDRPHTLEVRFQWSRYNLVTGTFVDDGFVEVMVDGVLVSALCAYNLAWRVKYGPPLSLDVNGDWNVSLWPRGHLSACYINGAPTFGDGFGQVVPMTGQVGGAYVHSGGNTNYPSDVKAGAAASLVYNVNFLEGPSTLETVFGPLGPWDYRYEAGFAAVPIDELGPSTTGSFHDATAVGWLTTGTFANLFLAVEGDGEVWNRQGMQFARAAPAPEPEPEPEACEPERPTVACWSGDGTPSVQCVSDPVRAAAATWSSTFSPGVLRVGVKESDL